MTLPYSNSIKETMSENRQVAVRKTDRFMMIPVAISKRKDITAAAKLVAGAMAMESYGSGIAKVSDGVLAEVTGVSRGQIVEIRKVLETARVIERHGEPIAQVQPYRLMFMATDVEKVAGKPITRRPQRELSACPLCKDLCVASKKTGWCRKCTADARNRQISRTMVREEVTAEFGRRAAG